MKQLLLLRHAKAEAARTGLPDVERALSAGGRANALEAAQCIAHAGLPIDVALSSPAVRARDTALIVATALDIASLLRFEPDMYPGTPGALLALLQRCEPQARSILMIGHNPGISELAQQLASGGPALELRTAGLCRLQFALTSWNDVKFETAVSCTLLR
jgi:phosphohistidine phosphatase